MGHNSPEMTEKTCDQNEHFFQDIRNLSSYWIKRKKVQSAKLLLSLFLFLISTCSTRLTANILSPSSQKFLGERKNIAQPNVCIILFGQNFPNFESTSIDIRSCTSLLSSKVLTRKVLQCDPCDL